MTITRLYSGDDGESHFEDIELEADSSAHNAVYFSAEKAECIQFGESDGSVREDGWHNAPRRQYVLMLMGAIEVEIAGGTTRQFRPGDILLAEDLEGRGHLTRVLDTQPQKFAVIPLE